MRHDKSVRIQLSLNAQKELFSDCSQRRDIEACGVLIGDIDERGNWYVAHAYPLRNIAASSVYFEFAPEELLEAELAHPEQIVGVYHSHPTGFAKASSTDRQNMQRVNQEQEIPWAWLIICGPFDASFAQRSQGRIPRESVIAYHHYQERGLERIAIYFEDGEEKEQQHTDIPDANTA